MLTARKNENLECDGFSHREGQQLKLLDSIKINAIFKGETDYDLPRCYYWLWPPPQ